METMSNIPSKGTKKRVVIVGGGFGGLKLARRLNDRDFQVILLDRNNYHLFQPLLYQVATSGIEPSAISFPFRKIFKRRHDFHVRICTAERVIPQENRLETSIGDVSYDYLVIATGAGTNYFGDQTLAQRTMQLKTTSDALFNRNRMIESFERALNTSNAEERRHWLTFVIVGGGATGIELAGALAEMRKDYPELDWNEMRILLVDGGERLLNAFSQKSSEDVIRNLKDMKVEVLLKKFVKEYDGKKLTFVDGEQVVTNNVFWVAGVKASSLEGLPQDIYGRGNRLLVDEFNRIQGMADIFALGDTALMVAENYPNGHPQVVQPSIQQASLLAKNLRHMIKGKPLRPFKYMNKGSMATIGRNDAVAEISGIRFSGFFAWLLWLLVHLMSIVGVKNRLFIFINWMWSYVTYDQSLRLLIKPEVKKSDPF